MNNDAKSVFIGGSIGFRHLPTSVYSRIDNIIKNQFRIYVGDAPGVDVLVQNYLKEKEYKNLTVFYSFNNNKNCRNNVGNWLTHAVPAHSSKSLRQFYQEKDKVMTEKATWGMMIWDGKSQGTFANIKRLLAINKQVLVFIDEKDFLIKNKESFDVMIKSFQAQQKTIQNQNQ
jgi:hypothetical protein